MAVHDIKLSNQIMRTIVDLKHIVNSLYSRPNNEFIYDDIETITNAIDELRNDIKAYEQAVTNKGEG